MHPTPSLEYSKLTLVETALIAVEVAVVCQAVAREILTRREGDEVLLVGRAAGGRGTIDACNSGGEHCAGMTLGFGSGEQLLSLCVHGRHWVEHQWRGHLGGGGGGEGGPAIQENQASLSVRGTRRVCRRTARSRARQVEQSAATRWRIVLKIGTLGKLQSFAN